jgi:putative endonuclease
VFTVYVLFSTRHHKIYIGYTSNLTNRILSHNSLGKKGYTLKYRPWVVAFTETYPTKSAAMGREQFLKSGIGRQLISAKIREQGLISA